LQQLLVLVSVMARWCVGGRERERAALVRRRREVAAATGAGVSHGEVVRGGEREKESSPGEEAEGGCSSYWCWCQSWRGAETDDALSREFCD
jgi:hypothetical protein